MSDNLPKKITNASLYLKALSESERESLRIQVESLVLSHISKLRPGEVVVVPDLCQLLGLNPAQRQILNGLLKQLDRARFGTLVLGRKGHQTKFICWTGELVGDLHSRIKSELPNHSTVLDAMVEARVQLSQTTRYLDDILERLQDGHPVSHD